MSGIFGDLRLDKRYASLKAALLNKPECSLPELLPSWSKLKAAYRFFKQPQS